METTERLGRRIRTAHELHAVVRAMKSLASVSIRQYERAAAALGHYVNTIDLGYRILARTDADLLLRPTPPTEGRTAMIVFGSDQGLCGTFDRSIAAFAVEHLRDAPRTPAPLVAGIGGRAVAELETRGWKVDVTWRVPASVEAVSGRVDDVLLAIDAWRTEAPLGRVVLIHHRPGESRLHHPAAAQLFPFDLERVRRLAKHPWPTRMVPMSPLDGPALLAALTRASTFAVLFRAFVESLASEHQARLAAMQGAERSIEERLEELGRAYHQLRQATITEELLDVTAGFEALASEGNGTAALAGG